MQPEKVINMSYNVIGDIAGNYKTLLALIDKMPKGKIVAVGDIVDRGPRSKQVVEYFMEQVKLGNAECLLGNHEHMMIDHYRQTHMYDSYIWHMNGGDTTSESFAHNIPQTVIEFLENRPINLELDLGGKKCYISHAFKPTGRSVDEEEEETFRTIWNRAHPFFNTESADIQICGHNSQYGLRYWNADKYKYGEKQAICIDTSRDAVLTGIHLPTLTIYQQEYID